MEGAAANREAATIENYFNFDQIFPSPSPSLQSLFAVTLSSVLRESPDPAGAWLPPLDAKTLTLIYILVNCLHALVSSSFSLLKMQLLLMSVNETHLKGIAPSLNPAWINNHWKLPPPEDLSQGWYVSTQVPYRGRAAQAFVSTSLLTLTQGAKSQRGKGLRCLPHLPSPLCKSLHAEYASRARSRTRLGRRLSADVRD